MASASPSESVRSWRTAFLTLRDETLAPLSPTTLPNLIRILVFSQSEALVLAARDLPPHEVTSDIMLLVELVSSIPEGKEVAGTYVHTCHLIHGVSCHVLLQMKPNSWTFLLDLFEKIVELFLCKADMKTALLGGADRIKAIKEILETLRVEPGTWARVCPRCMPPTLIEAYMMANYLEGEVVGWNEAHMMIN